MAPSALLPGSGWLVRVTTIFRVFLKPIFMVFQGHQTLFRVFFGVFKFFKSKIS